MDYPILNVLLIQLLQRKGPQAWSFEVRDFFEYGFCGPARQLLDVFKIFCQFSDVAGSHADTFGILKHVRPKLCPDGGLVLFVMI